MKRTISLLLLFVLVTEVARAPYAIAAEQPTNRFGRWGVYLKEKWQNPTCRKSIAWIGGAAVIGLLSWGYYNHYTPGNIRNVGTQDRPIWRPELGNTFIVDERITMLNIPRERQLVVTDGQKRYGAISFKEDKIRWTEGEKVIAETCVVSPYGRPFSSDPEHAIVVTVHDTQRKIIGSIEERSDEITPGTHRIFFIVRDDKGQEVGRTEPFEESNQSKRTDSKPWVIEFDNEGPRMTRSGWITSRYKIAAPAQAEETFDERLTGLLAALKSYTEAYRGEE